MLTRPAGDSRTRRIVRIELTAQGQNRRNPPYMVRELLDLVAREREAGEGGLAVAEPLLEDLIAAEGVAPDRFGNVFPAGGFVEVDVEVPIAAGAGGDFAGAW